MAAAKFLAVRRIRLRIFSSLRIGCGIFSYYADAVNSYGTGTVNEAGDVCISCFCCFSLGEEKKQFLKSLACFYIMNFAFAGFMMAIWYFISPQGMIIKNSIVYFNISPIILIGSTAVCYVVIRFIYRFIGKHEVSGGCCTVTVVWKEKTVECNAKN